MGWPCFCFWLLSLSFSWMEGCLYSALAGLQILQLADSCLHPSQSRESSPICCWQLSSLVFVALTSREHFSPSSWALLNCELSDSFGTEAGAILKSTIRVLWFIKEISGWCQDALFPYVYVEDGFV